MFRYDGLDAAALARDLDLPAVAVHASVGSTMDEAHALARGGAPSGTLVLADRQEQGRGRGGKVWASPAGRGIWMTLIERPRDPSGIEVLSLRIGVRLARALDRFAGLPVHVKWPNDLMIGDRKVAGILVEARWRDQRLEWVAIGIGINLHLPDGQPGAASLGDGVSRLEVLREIVPIVRGALHAGWRGGRWGIGGALDDHDLRVFAERDWARGRRARLPERGIVAGVSPGGALLVQTEHGIIACSSGSLVIEEEP